jgi:hypothetical protein
MNNDNGTKNSYNAAKTPAVTKTKRRYRNNLVHSVYECLLCQKKKTHTHAVVHPNPGEPGSVKCTSWYENPTTYYSETAKKSQLLNLEFEGEGISSQTKAMVTK